MTRNQSNNQWNDGIAAHPAPKKFRVQKSAGKVLAPIFIGIKTASSSLIIFQKAKLSTRSIVISAGATEGHFEGKTPQEDHQGGLVLARQCRGSPGTCNPEEIGFTWASSVLIAHPILRIWPRQTTTCPLD